MNNKENRTSRKSRRNRPSTLLRELPRKEEIGKSRNNSKTSRLRSNQLRIKKNNKRSGVRTKSNKMKSHIKNAKKSSIRWKKRNKNARNLGMILLKLSTRSSKLSQSIWLSRKSIKSNLNCQNLNSKRKSSKNWEVSTNPLRT